jgi:signal transduction histidine kinase
VRADDALLEQVLFNLLDNSAKALRFVTHRIPTITVTTRKLNDELVELVVHDNGLGITPDDLPHVFNRYFTTYAKGTGLGLYYARVIVEDIHKGKIVIESKWGSSTTVRVHLPWCP